MRKKKKEEPQKPKTVRCPVRGHRHELELLPHPERPDLVIARCGDRDVYQAPASESIRPVDPKMAGFTYVVNHYQGE